MSLSRPFVIIIIVSILACDQFCYFCISVRRWLTHTRTHTHTVVSLQFPILMLSFDFVVCRIFELVFCCGSQNSDFFSAIFFLNIFFFRPGLLSDDWLFEPSFNFNFDTLTACAALCLVNYAPAQSGANIFDSLAQWPQLKIENLWHEKWVLLISFGLH